MLRALHPARGSGKVPRDVSGARERASERARGEAPRRRARPAPRRRTVEQLVDRAREEEARASPAERREHERDGGVDADAEVVAHRPRRWLLRRRRVAGAEAQRPPVDRHNLRAADVVERAAQRVVPAAQEAVARGPPEAAREVVAGADGPHAHGRAVLLPEDPVDGAEHPVRRAVPAEHEHAQARRLARALERLDGIGAEVHQAIAGPEHRAQPSAHVPGPARRPAPPVDEHEQVRLRLGALGGPRPAMRVTAGAPRTAAPPPPPSPRGAAPPPAHLRGRRDRPRRLHRHRHPLGSSRAARTITIHRDDPSQHDRDDHPERISSRTG